MSKSWQTEFDKWFNHGTKNEPRFAYSSGVYPEVKAFIQDLLDRKAEITGETSDGYHTFNELYEFRKLYNAALFNEWASQGKYNVHKSTKHHDGEGCFGGGWFIVMATLPTGQISNHYEMKDWDLFNIPERDMADEWDGHTTKDVIDRLKAISILKEEWDENKNN